MNEEMVGKLESDRLKVIGILSTDSKYSSILNYWVRESQEEPTVEDLLAKAEFHFMQNESFSFYKVIVRDQLNKSYLINGRLNSCSCKKALLKECIHIISLKIAISNKKIKKFIRDEQENINEYVSSEDV